MKLTKYEHACFTVEKNGQVIVVDPGAFTTDFEVAGNIIAVIVTHEHSDHFDEDQLAAIAKKNPNAILFAHTDITSKTSSLKCRNVASGDIIELASFHLEFFGGKHLQTLPSSPVFANLGVLIDGKVCYGGDSFARPSRQAEVLVLPVCGSWMKLSMAYEYFIELKPSIVIPTHDAILSENGKKQVDKHIPLWTTDFEYTYTRATSGIIL